MTTKEKAKELYNKYEDSISGVEGSYWFESAKKCALVAVDEILNLDYFSVEGREYWQEVKQEIINL